MDFSKVFCTYVTISPIYIPEPISVIHQVVFNKVLNGVVSQNNHDSALQGLLLLAYRNKALLGHLKLLSSAALELIFPNKLLFERSALNVRIPCVHAMFLSVSVCNI